jgi:lysophospholipase L1-like esterase
MNVAILVLSLGLLAGSRDGDTAVFRQLIGAYFDAVAHKNFVKMSELCTGDFVVYEHGKIWNNDSVFENIRYHEPFTVKFTLTGFQFFADTRSGEGSYHSHADFVVEDTVQFSLDFIESAAFRRTADGWKIRMIHITLLEPPVVDVVPFYRRYDTVRYVPEHYAERVKQFASAVVPPGETIFLGNSITEFSDWKINRGIAGDNTFGMLDRLDEVIRRRPRLLFIEAGINDIGQGVPVGMIAGNIGTLVGLVRVKSPGTRVFVVSVLPTNEHARDHYPDVAGKNAVVLEVDRRLREAAAGAGYTYIDLASRLMDGAGNLDARYAQPDGLHLNKAGYAVTAGVLKKVMSGE